MREIKFRAWILPKQRWADELNIEFTYYGIPPRFNAMYHSNPEWYGNNDLIVEQYTGLKDENGKKIYEGDVIRVCECVDRGDGYMDDLLTEVIFFEGSWMTNEPPHFPVNRLFDTLQGHDVSIVGNIHENPELLSIRDE